MAHTYCAIFYFFVVVVIILHYDNVENNRGSASGSFLGPVSISLNHVDGMNSPFFLRKFYNKELNLCYSKVLTY